MRTFQFQNCYALDELVAVEGPVPSPGPREVLLRMRAVSLNYRDLAIARGTYGDWALPRVPLSDGAGEVVASGPGVTRFAQGDLVCPAYVPDWIDGPLRASTGARRLGGPVDGVLADYVVVDEDAAVRAPRHLDAVEASTLPVAAVTAWQALVVDARIAPGDVVAVRGTGGVSLFVDAFARAAGARCLVLARGEDRAARVAALGGEAIDASGEPRWPHLVLERTDGRGADVTVDVVGGSDVAAAIEATRVGGTVALVGFAGGGHAELDLIATIRRGVTLRAASAGSRASFEALARAMEASRLRPTVDRVFDRDEVHAAYMHIAEGRPFGKVVVSLDERGRAS